VAGESLHPHGGKHQVDLERRRRNRSRVLAPECIWTNSFPLADTRWIETLISTEDIAIPRLATGTDTTTVPNAASNRHTKSRRWRRRI
jgi:hypothetical protein